MSRASIKNVVMITRNFPPLIGGMEKLNFNIYKYLTSITDVHLIGPRGAEKFIDSSATLNTFPIKPLWLYILISLLRSISLFYKKPELVFCGSGAAALAGYVLSRLSSSKLVIYLHGLDIVANNNLYQLLFVPCIKRADKIIVNSQYTKSLAVKACFDASKISVLNPGIELPDFEKFTSKKREVIDRYQLQNKKILLILGRITKRKGIVEFIQNAMPLLVQENPNIHLLIAGSEAINAMNHDENITSKILQKICEKKLVEHITLTGHVSDEMLDDIYFSADLMVFPVLDMNNDVEGFGMVAVEAAAHGIKTIAFNVGGVSDAIKEGESGCLIESGDYNRFANVILSNLIHQQGKPDSSVIEFSKKYQWSEFNKKFRSILCEVINDEP